MRLQVHDIVITPEGSLLVLYHVIPGGCNIDDLRLNLKGRFPCATKMQTQRIVHSTLVRLVGPGLREAEALPRAAVAAERARHAAREMGLFGHVAELDQMFLSGCRGYYDVSRFLHVWSVSAPAP